MSDHLPVILTSKDYVLLETLLGQWREPFPGAAEAVRRKLSAATLVFPADIPADVVTVNSRVRFRREGALTEERVIVAGPSEEIYGLTLTLDTPRGLALIGARAGQTVWARQRSGTIEHLFVEAVPYQPEQKRKRPALAVVSRSEPEDGSAVASNAGGYKRGLGHGFDDDDPGPSAA